MSFRQWLMASLFIIYPNFVFSADLVKLSHEDKNFILDANQGGLMEVELGNLALQKSQNPAVQKYAQQMVVDHGFINKQLAILAKKAGVKLTHTLQGTHQKQVNILSQYQGAAFDTAYTQAMIEDHENDVSNFKNVARYAQNQLVKTFAQNTLPILQAHLRRAKNLQAMIASGIGGAGQADKQSQGRH